jgi:hypothetical protein
MDLSEVEWSEIDGLILGCQQSAALRRIREMIGKTAEEATHILLQRYHFLRVKRAGDFAWNDFPCDDYIDSEWAEHGCWADPYTRVIVPASGVSVREDLEFLVVGGPGVDGVLWGYRRANPGIWEYQPIDGEFILMADTLEDLIIKEFLA